MKLKTRLLIDYYVGGTAHAILKPLVILLGRVLRRNHDLSKCQDVTIVKLLGGGSLIIAYPALLAIRRLPNVKRLRLVASPLTSAFGALLGIFDEIIILHEDSALALATNSLGAIRRLWRTDVLIDLEIHSRLSTIFCLLTCARNRVGFYTQESFWRKGLSTHLLFCQLAEGVYHFYDQVSRLLGAPPMSFRDASDSFRTRLALSEKIARDPTAKIVPRIAIAACCSELGKERMMKVPEWIDILRRRFALHQPPTELHLLGSATDRPYLEELQRSIMSAWPNIQVFNHAGELKLEESVKLLATMDELLAIDSSLLHIARLLGIKTISFWGPTAPTTRLRISDLAADEIHYAQLPCSPCVHISSTTPCKGNNLCMRFVANPDYPGDRNPPWLV